MQVHLQTKVLPGNRIELVDPSLPEGASVSVTVLIPNGEAEISGLELLESLPARRAYSTPEEADAEIRRERDSWDR